MFSNTASNTSDKDNEILRPASKSVEDQTDARPSYLHSASTQSAASFGGFFTEILQLDITQTQKFNQPVVPLVGCIYVINPHPMWEDGYLRFLIILGMMRDMLHLEHGRSLAPYAQML